MKSDKESKVNLVLFGLIIVFVFGFSWWKLANTDFDNFLPPVQELEAEDYEKDLSNTSVISAIEEMLNLSSRQAQGKSLLILRVLEIFIYKRDLQLIRQI